MKKSEEFRTSTAAGRHEAAQTLSVALAKEVEELEKQLISSFEKDSATVKSALINRRLITDPMDPAIEAEEDEMAIQAKKAFRLEKNFGGFMSIATRELELLTEHRKTMEKTISNQKLKNVIDESAKDADDPSKDVLPTKPVAEATDNPFVPNDSIISKYSMIVQVSQDGSRFYDLPVNEPCGMCGLSSVLVCPHHILSRKLTIAISPTTRYLRIVRPTQRITTSEIVEPQVDIKEMDIPFTKKPSVSGEDDQPVTYERPKPRDLSDEKTFKFFPMAVERILESQFTCTDPRSIPDEKMYLICEEILSFLLTAESASPHKPFSLFKNFVTCFENGYHNKPAAHLVVGDFLHNLAPMIKKNDRYAQLFGLMMNGVVDSA